MKWNLSINKVEYTTNASKTKLQTPKLFDEPTSFRFLVWALLSICRKINDERKKCTSQVDFCFVESSLPFNVHKKSPSQRHMHTFIYIWLAIWFVVRIRDCALVCVFLLHALCTHSTIRCLISLHLWKVKEWAANLKRIDGFLHFRLIPFYLVVDMANKKKSKVVNRVGNDSVRSREQLSRVIFYNSKYTFGSI